MALNSTCLMPVCLWLALSVAPASPATVIPDSEYVTVKDGHLYLKNTRVRFWGAIGAFSYGSNMLQSVRDSSVTPAQHEERVQKAYRDLTAAAHRLHDLGFNMYRMWHTPEVSSSFTKGDGSVNDLIAYWLNELDKLGIKLWNSATNRAPVGPDDAALVNDPATEQAWKAAMGELAGRDGRGGNARISAAFSVARIWDPRIEAAGIAFRKQCADFRNPYRNNIRWGDDPQIAIWELSNEERWMRKMLTGEWKKLPAFFQKELIGLWHAFLKGKYGSEASLRKAWLNLLPGESLKMGSIQLMPLKTEADIIIPYDPNPQVLALLKQTAHDTYSRDDFNRRRGEDVLQFLVTLLVEHKKRESAALKSFGASCRLCPCAVDAGDSYDMQSLWKFQNSDAVSEHNYAIGQHYDSMHKRFPWASRLDSPPRLRNKITYITTQRIPDKPYFLYEVGYENPAKYRAEYPYQIVALASIQDFDAICWHVMTNRLHDSDSKDPYSGPLDLTVPWNNNPEGLHYRYDEVMQSAMQGAGEIFKNMCLLPAPNPTTYIFGKKSLYDPASMDFGVAYGQYGPSVQPTTFRYGSRMYIDTTRETDSVVGPALLYGGDETIPLRPSDNIEYNWQKAYMKFDSPRSAMYTGFYAEYGGPVTFRNGVILDKVTVINPPGIAYPVAKDELYLAFSLTARDGKALTETEDAFLSLVSTSFNTGFKLDHSKLVVYDGWRNNPGCMPSAGTAPVLVARMGAEITAPAIDGMAYTMVDFHMRSLAEGRVTKGKITIPADKPVYAVFLHGRGGPVRQ
jgi:hypothetical protein